MTSQVYGVAFAVMVATVCGVSLVAKPNVDGDTLFNILTADGKIIQENIYVTGTEEGIVLTDGATKSIYEAGFMTVKLNDEGVEKCFVSSFKKPSMESPGANEQVKQTVTSGEFAELSEKDYYVDATFEVDPAILSATSIALCEHLSIQWMSEETIMPAGMNL